MRTKKFKIKIQSLDQFGKDFVETWKKAEQRQLKGSELILSFADVSQLTKVLSLERLRLCQVVRDKKPNSINQLARMLGRAQSNVQKDVHELAELGVLHLERTTKKGQKKETVQPKFEWGGFDIAV